MIPQLFPGMALPLKVFIQGAPKCSPDAKVFIKCPTSTPGWVGIRGWKGSSRGTHPHLVVQGLQVGMVDLGEPTPIWLCRDCRLEWLTWGNPPSPSWRGDLLVILSIGIPISYWVSPRHWWRASGGCIQLMECDLSMGILHKLAQFALSARFPRSHLETLWHSLRQVGVTSRWMEFLFPIRGWRLGSWWLPTHCSHIGPHMGHGRGRSPYGNGFHT